MFDIALTHGVTQVSCKNFVDCGIIQASILGNPEVAYRLGRAAFKLLERYAPTPLESSVNFVFGSFVSHWKAPYREGVAAFELAIQRGTELGDIQHVSYALVHGSHRSILDGQAARRVQKRARRSRGLPDARPRGRPARRRCHQRARHRAPLGSDGDDVAAERADANAAARVDASMNAQWAYSYGQSQTMVSFLLGDLDSARTWSAYTARFSLAAASLFSVPDYRLFDGLIAARSCASATESERAAFLTTINEALGKLEAWSNACPENFAHKYHLLAAELARVLGGPLEAVLASYQRSLVAAGNDFPHLRALVHEREGELWLELGNERYARSALEASYRLYADWGALAKLRQLETKYPTYLDAGSLRSAPQARTISHSTTSSNVAGALDASSILKSTKVSLEK